MRYRVFLDTNVFIYAFEFPESNSHHIIELLNEGRLDAVISERVLKEVHAYFKKFYDKDLASAFRDYLLRTCTVILASEVRSELPRYRRLIKEKDLEQLTVVKKLGIKFLVAYDRDFENVREYTTPRVFIKELGFKPAATAY